MLTASMVWLGLRLPTNHEIRFFEFVRPDGRTITSFFQVVRKPNLGIGCFDFYEDAIELMNHPALHNPDDTRNIGQLYPLKLVEW